MIWPIVSALEMVHDPVMELQRMHREMDRLLHGGYRGDAGYPAMNVWAKDDAAQVVAAVPGLKPEDLSLTVEARILAIEGERKAEAAADGTVRSERPAGRFSRRVRLPFDVDGARVTARYDRGLVTITLPRSEDSKPRKIAVQAG